MSNNEIVDECFGLFDRDNDGYLSSSEFKTAVRSLGKFGGYPSEDELRKYVESAHDGKMSKLEFTSIMSQRISAFQRAGGVDGFFGKIDNPFNVLAKSGTVNGRELKDVLTTLADKLSKAEYEQLFKITGIQGGDGPIDHNALYAKMVQILKS